MPFGESGLPCRRIAARWGSEIIIPNSMPAAAFGSSSRSIPRLRWVSSHAASATGTRWMPFSVEGLRQFGKPVQLRDHQPVHAEHFLVERQPGAVDQHGFERRGEVGAVDHVGNDTCEELVEARGHHLLEQRRLGRDQAVERFGRDPGAGGDVLHAGGGVPAFQKLLARGFMDEVARDLVGAGLWPAPASLHGLVTRFHPGTLLIAAM